MKKNIRRLFYFDDDFPNYIFTRNHINTSIKVYRLCKFYTHTQDGTTRCKLRYKDGKQTDVDVRRISKAMRLEKPLKQTKLLRKDCEVKYTLLELLDAKRRLKERNDFWDEDLADEAIYNLTKYGSDVANYEHAILREMLNIKIWRRKHLSKYHDEYKQRK